MLRESVIIFLKYTQTVKRVNEASQFCYLKIKVI